MRMRDPPPWGWDKTNDRPLLRLESEKVYDGFKLVAMGHDDEMANTMFAVVAEDGERLLTRYPEPLLVEYVQDILDAGAFTVKVGDGPAFGVTLDEDYREKVKRMKEVLAEAVDEYPR